MRRCRCWFSWAEKEMSFSAWNGRWSNSLALFSIEILQVFPCFFSYIFFICQYMSYIYIYICFFSYFNILILHLRKDRDIMLRLALDKAARSWDPDLMHSALSAACLGDPCERSSDIQSCARLIKEKLYDLQVVGWWFPAPTGISKMSGFWNQITWTLGMSCFFLHNSWVFLQREPPTNKKRGR